MEQRVWESRCVSGDTLRDRYWIAGAPRQEKKYIARYNRRMIGRPLDSEAAPYYFTYINQAPGDDPVALIEQQLDPSLDLFSSISEEKSLHRYAPGKWSIRELLNHVSDTERAFAFRVLWFGRGFQDPLASYDQNIAASGAVADRVPWSAHVEEFRRVRLSTVSLLQNLSPEAWQRGGIASGQHVTVRALAYIIAGHLTHHARVLQEKYL